MVKSLKGLEVTLAQIARLPVPQLGNWRFWANLLLGMAVGILGGVITGVILLKINK